MVTFNNLENEIIMLADEASPIQDPIEREIMSLATLQEGWDYGQGLPPSKETIERAIGIYRKGKKYNLYAEVFPIGEGEIVISFSHKDVFIDILVQRDGSYQLSVEEGIGEEYQLGEVSRNISIEEIDERLKELSGFDEWSSSESCESDPMIGEENAFFPKVFGITAVQSRLSIKNAFSVLIKPQYVPI